MSFIIVASKLESNDLKKSETRIDSQPKNVAWEVNWKKKLLDEGYKKNGGCEQIQHENKMKEQRISEQRSHMREVELRGRELRSRENKLTSDSSSLTDSTLGKITF